jgi:ATPase subunit of ABC transporter with duplicated ATPase domains
MLILQNITYTHPDGELLFDNITLSVGAREKIAVVAGNGAGKSTLLKIAGGLAPPSSGTVTASSKPYYLPQIAGQYDCLSLAEALGVEGRLRALGEILSGDVSAGNWAALDDDWAVEDRCREALALWELPDLPLTTKMGALSGGQKTRVFLAGIHINDPRIILLDEPTNHLDRAGRDMLYRLIEETSRLVVVVSHDRTLLNITRTIYELGRHGIKVYGGNYEFYKERKALDKAILADSLEEKRKALRKARKVEQATIERQQKQMARGKGRQQKEGAPGAMIDKMRNDAQRSAARLTSVHAARRGASMSTRNIPLSTAQPSPSINRRRPSTIPPSRSMR